MQKNRAPYPFETIATAITFSPRMDALIGESVQLAKRFNAKLVFIHIGDKAEGRKDELHKIIERLANGVSFSIACRTGEPVETILQVCKENIVDLLVIGALEKETLLKYFFGSIARNICRKAKCSVLLLTQPSINERKFESIVINAKDNPKTSFTIETASYFAKTYNINELQIVVEHQLSPALYSSLPVDINEDEAQKLKEDLQDSDILEVKNILKKVNTNGLKLKVDYVSGKPGFAINNYTREHNYDLLVVNSPDEKLNILDRIFTNDMEYLLENLPSNMLIVHSRINEN
jgi:nucleotide-binding universal stress UspA family protein